MQKRNVIGMDCPHGTAFCPRADVPGVDAPGSGPHPATGRPGVDPGSGLILAPRGPGRPAVLYDIPLLIHYESQPGVPDTPPHHDQGFRCDVYI